MEAERINYMRSVYLVLEYGTRAIRIYFDSKIPQSNLETVLNQYEHEIKRSSLSRGQLDALYNGSTVMPNLSSEKFDINTMIAILRNSRVERARKNEWDNLPSFIDTNVKAVAMIKHYRNDLCHPSRKTAILSESEFNGVFMDVLNAIHQLGGPQLHQSAEAVRHANLNEIEHSRMIELFSMVNSLDTRMETLERDLSKRRCVIENARRMLEKPLVGPEFVETAALHDGMRLLKDKGVLIYLGAGGDGKTTNAQAILSKVFAEEDDCEIMNPNITELIEWKTLLNSDNKKYIFLDDILSDEQSRSHAVLQFFSYAINLVGAQVKIIMCLRNQAYTANRDITGRYDIFDKRYCIDLTQEQNKLTVEEKESILRKHLENSASLPITITPDLDKENIYKDDILDDRSKVIIANWTLRKIAAESKGEGYPESCREFAKNRQFLHLGPSFFLYPKKNVIDGLNTLRGNIKSKDPFRDKLNYCTLVYVFHKSELHCDMIDLRSFETIVEALGFEHDLRGVTVNTIASAARELAEDIYLVASSNGVFRYRHDTIAEAVICSYGAVCQADIIEQCDYRILFEFVRTQAIEQDHGSGEFCVIIRPRYFGELAERFLKEVRKNNGLTVAGHPAMDDESFIDIFMRKLIETGSEKQFVSENGENVFETLFTGACYFRRHTFANCLLKNTRLPLPLTLFALVYACHSGLTNQAKTYFEFLSKRVLPEMLRTVYLKCLFAASETGHENVVKLILRTLEDPKPEDFIEAFHTAGSHGQVHIAELIRTYTEERQPCLTPEHLGKALIAASSKGDVKTTEWLMRGLCEIGDEYVVKALKRACMFENIEVADKIISLTSQNETLCQNLRQLYQLCY